MKEFFALLLFIGLTVNTALNLQEIRELEARIEQLEQVHGVHSTEE